MEEMEMWPTLAQVEQMAEKVDTKRCPSKCWVYTKHMTRNGYAVFAQNRDGKRVEKLAAKHVLDLQGKSLPEGYAVLRRCRNSFCCNPEHIGVIPQWYVEDNFKKKRPWTFKKSQ